MLLFWYKSCGDAMYSGHTCSFMLFGWLTSRHLESTLWHWGIHPSRASRRLLRACVWAVCLFAVLTLLLTRSHYTVDVVVAMAISSSLFVMYHAWLVIEASRAAHERSWLATWLEGPQLRLEKEVFTAAVVERCEPTGGEHSRAHLAQSGSQIGVEFVALAASTPASDVSRE